MSIKSLHEIGLLKDCTNFDLLNQVMQSKKIKFYFGIDLTAEGLHVGHLSGLMMARRLLKMGHHAIILLGGATTKIGDPTGKDKERPIISDEIIAMNKKGIKQDVMQILSGFEESIEFVDNSDWLLNLNYIEMLNEIGRHFTLSKMLSLDSVKLRLDREQSITFTEFNYSIIQGYDFYYLAKHKNCIMQLGGSDQWGNITSGTELARKKLSSEVFGLTIPLLVTHDGKKMGKTEGGAVWLSSKKLNDFDYFQYFRNVDDRDVKQMLLTFTDFDFKIIQELSSYSGSKINEAKEILAFEATKICRGIDIANECLKSAKNLYSQDNLQEDIKLEEIKSSIDDKITHILVNNKICSSNSDAKTLVASGAIYINDLKITDINHKFIQGAYILKVGKKRAFNLVVQN